MSFFLLLNTKEYILKNVGNETKVSRHLFTKFFKIYSFVFSRRNKFLKV